MNTDRYSRQRLFAPIGEGGQKRLARSRVLIVGGGALGSAHAETLSRAGVGYLRIVDRDFVEASNLQRQTLFSEADADERLPKAIAAKNRLSAINSSVEVDAHVADVNNSNIESLARGCDLIIDGADNFEVRYLINDACVKHDIPWIYGAAVSSYGTTMTVLPGETMCLRCVFEEMPAAGSAATCDTSGVLMSIIQTVSAAQTTEAIKLLIGEKTALHRSLVEFDVWTNEMRKIKLGCPSPDCPTCGLRKFEFLDAERADFSAVLCGRNAVQISPANPAALDLYALATRVSPAVGNVTANEYLLRFSVDGNDVTIFGDGRAIIAGTDDPSQARSIYAKFVGV